MTRWATLVTAVLCLTSALHALAQPSGPDGNLPLPSGALRHKLLNEPFEIVDVGKTVGGITTTEKVTLYFPADDLRIKAKWKAAPMGGEGWNNYPRREVAAYAVQQLFLDPEEYVVPPSVARCIPLDVYGPIQPNATPNMPHAQCVYGTLSAWLDNVEEPKETYDVERFQRDPRFAHLFGNLNILTYLIAHRDRRPSNFLISTDELNPQMFSVDNGIAFGGVMYNFFNWHFDNVVVRSLPADAVTRLRHVTPEQLNALAVLEELQPDEHGILRPAAPSPVPDALSGQRYVGKGVQIGLTAAEIAEVSHRIRELLAAVDSGQLTVF